MNHPAGSSASPDDDEIMDAVTDRADWWVLLGTGSGTIGRRERVWVAAVAVLGLVHMAYLEYARHDIGVPRWVGWICAGLFAAGCGWAVWLGLSRGTRRRRQGMVLLALLVVLALGRAVVHHAFSDLMYLGIVCALLLPIRMVLPAVAAITLAQAFLMVTAGKIVPTGAIGFALQTAFLGLASFGLRRMLELTRELAAARQELARLAVSEERLRFSRDLHDLLGHSLSLIALKSDLVRRMVVGKPVAPEIPDVAAEIDDIQTVARRALTEVREAVSGYRRQTLSTELDCALEILEVAGIHATLIGDTPPMSEPVEVLLAYVVREGVTNVVRHSRANCCEIALQRVSDVVRLDIVDDGIGATGTAHSSGSSGSGLMGLSERIASAGGSLEARSESGGGFRLTATVPLAGPRNGGPAGARAADQS